MIELVFIGGGLLGLFTSLWINRSIPYFRNASLESYFNDGLWLIILILFLLLIVTSILVTSLGVLSVLKPFYFELLRGHLYPFTRAATPLTSLLRTAVAAQGSKCLMAMGPLLTGTGLFCTAGYFMFDRLFTKSIETVNTMHRCHTDYHDLFEDYTCSAIAPTLSRLSEFYQCEYHFYLRGLLPTKVFAAWMASWRSKATTWNEAMTAAVSEIGDDSFTKFCKELPTEKQNIEKRAADARWEWQLTRYGFLFAWLIRFIDHDHRSRWITAD